MNQTMSTNETISDLEWDNRVLCSDESCIGVIGSDGCCKVCGKPYQGDLPAGLTGHVDRTSQPGQTPDQSAEPTHENGSDGDRSADTEIRQSAAADEDWNKRTLCRDEACIGVIGPDGKCKECGLPYDQ